MTSTPGATDRTETPAERADRNWNELLQELRVTQTGVAILFSVLLTVPFSERFGKLDDFGRQVYLAALLLDHPRVAAGLAISGVFELGPIRDTYLNEKLRLTEAEVETLSPLRLPQAPKPLVIAYGTAELPALVADSRALHRLLEDAGAPSRLLPLAGHDHFSILDALRSPTGALSLAARTLA